MPQLTSIVSSADQHTDRTLPLCPRKFLLASTDEKVISIGFACGFGNLANFYRNFTARTGMTPKAWRKRGAITVPFNKP
jgi:AraC-like DNA-binding protein